MLVAVLVVVMVNLGFWQLRRLDEKRDHKALVEARQEQPAAPADELLANATDPHDPEVEAVVYRTATATGEYLDGATVIVENRTYNGASGGWILTPLDLGGGRALLVNRGFIGFNREGRIEAPPAPTGSVEVEGMLFPSQERQSFGARDPEDGTLAVLARVDLVRIDAQLDERLLPAYLQLTASDPTEPPTAEGAPQLVALGPPGVSEGPHLGYAVQWFIFSTIALGGYGLILRRQAIDEAKQTVAA